MEKEAEIQQQEDIGALPRHLTCLSGGLMNLGTNIGTGIFIVQGIMLKDLGSPGMVLLMFAAGALVSFFGAWAFVDLGLMRPVSGGSKEYLAMAFPKPHHLMGFTFSLVWILGVFPGQGAAVSVGFGKYFVGGLYGSPQKALENGNTFVAANYDSLIRILAAIAVVCYGFLHSLLPRLAIKFQNALGIIKSGVLVFACFLGVIAAFHGIPNLKLTSSYSNLFQGSKFEFTTIVNSFFKVLFSFDGWSTINYSLDEFIDPQKNLPRATFGAMIACTILYFGATLSYFLVVPNLDIMDPTKGVVGLQFFTKVLGPVFGGMIISLLIAIASFSCGLCVTFAASRLILACARDGYLPFSSKLSKTVGITQTPISAVWVYCAITLLYIFGPPPGKAYETLIDLCTYPEWIFYGLTVAGLLYYSRLHPTIPHPVRSPTITSVFFIIFCFMMMVMPFVPPSTPPEGIPYWVVPVIGMMIIFVCIAGWYVQIVVRKAHLSSFNSQKDIIAGSDRPEYLAGIKVAD